MLNEIEQNADDRILLYLFVFFFRLYLALI